MVRRILILLVLGASAFVPLSSMGQANFRAALPLADETGSQTAIHALDIAGKIKGSDETAL